MNRGPQRMPTNEAHSDDDCPPSPAIADGNISKWRQAEISESDTPGHDSHDSRILDILGIGFGPTNLALAIAVEEQNTAGRCATITAKFLERKPKFSWHPGMLLTEATMQVSFLKDLATLRNPTSSFGFLSYLHAKGRLVEFINHKILFPSRLEFHDYLQWSAGQVDQMACYGLRMLSARPVAQDGLVTHFEVLAQQDQRPGTTVWRTRNLVLAPGLAPSMPAGLRASSRIWHSDTLLDRLSGLVATPRRFVVLGAGQSAAETVSHLHKSFPEAEVCAVFSRFGYSQADDSPFANRVFDPGAVDLFYQAPEEIKEKILDYHANTNYSAVDGDLIENLYARFYQEIVSGIRRLRLINLAALSSVRESRDAVEVTVRQLNSNRLITLTADALVCATGYHPVDPLPLLGEAGTLLWRDKDGRLQTGRDYRVATGPEVLAGIYLSGVTEYAHGISSSLLSNTAIRAQEILDSVQGARAARAAVRA
jgi:L-ornithine N5-oxygenase